jgi:phosphocarrier protein FPr
MITTPGLEDQAAKTRSMMEVLTRDMVVIGAQAVDKEVAIRQAGEVLVRTGCVPPSYVDGMLARERTLSTYLGSGIAIPHGEPADLRLVSRTGVSVLQLPEGVEWEPGERAYLVVGLASRDNEHIRVLVNLVDLLQEPEMIKELIQAADPGVIVQKLTCGRSE